MKIKNIMTLILCMILLSISVLGAPSIETNESTNVETELFRIVTGSNETSFINYTVYQGSTIIVQSTFLANDTDSIVIIGNLEGNTLYDWQVDYTSLGATTSIFNSVTTDEYQFNATERIFYNLLTFVLLAIVLILVLVTELKQSKQGKKFDVMKVILMFAIGAIGAVILVNMIRGFLVL